MRTILALLVTALLAYLLDLFLPWWSIALAGFLVALMLTVEKGHYQFMAGFLGAGCLWLGAGLLSFYGDGGIIAGRIAEMFQLNKGSSLALIAALMAGLTTGFGALCGFYLKGMLQAPKTA